MRERHNRLTHSLREIDVIQRYSGLLLLLVVVGILFVIVFRALAFIGVGRGILEGIAAPKSQYATTGNVSRSDSQG